jgi:hypothetical protein
VCLSADGGTSRNRVLKVELRAQHGVDELIAKIDGVTAEELEALANHFK